MVSSRPGHAAMPPAVRSIVVPAADLPAIAAGLGLGRSARFLDPRQRPKLCADLLLLLASRLPPERRDTASRRAPAAGIPGSPAFAVTSADGCAIGFGLNRAGTIDEEVITIEETRSVTVPQAKALPKKMPGGLYFIIRKKDFRHASAYDPRFHSVPQVYAGKAHPYYQRFAVRDQAISEFGITSLYDDFYVLLAQVKVNGKVVTDQDTLLLAERAVIRRLSDLERGAALRLTNRDRAPVRAKRSIDRFDVLGSRLLPLLGFPPEPGRARSLRGVGANERFELNFPL